MKDVFPWESRPVLHVLRERESTINLDCNVFQVRGFDSTHN
jgi:hypothetical protein